MKKMKKKIKKFLFDEKQKERKLKNQIQIKF